jgi:antitoxin FitA
MTDITIRNVPEQLRDELAARAARSGMSLEQYLLWGLALMVDDPNQGDDPSQDEWLDDVRAQAREFGTNLSVEQILADRDADRR